MLNCVSEVAPRDIAQSLYADANQRYPDGLEIEREVVGCLFVKFFVDEAEEACAVGSEVRADGRDQFGR